MALAIWTYGDIRQEQKRTFTQKSLAIFNNAGVQLAETSSFITSIESMHYASDEFAGADIEAFASRVRQHSPYLQSLGMFQDVAGEMREFYQQYMEDEGHEDFTIHGYSQSGEHLLSESQPRYLPIHTITPPEAPFNLLLGTDLLSSPKIAQELRTAIDTAESLIVKTPEGWPAVTEYILLQPVYLGSSMPASLQERRDLFSGGIWISIDLALLMYKDENNGEKLPGTLTLKLNSGSNTSLITISDMPKAEQTGLDLNFEKLTTQKSWFLGDSTLTLSWQYHPKAPKQSVMNTLVLCSAILAITGFVLLFIRSKRRAQWERIENLKELSREREKAELTLSSISDAVISLDSNFHVIYMNASAIRFLLIDFKSVLGTPIDRVLHIDHSVQHNNAFPGFEKVLESLPAHTQTEFDVTLTLSHLKDATVKLTLSSICDDQNTIFGSIVVLEDVSLERRLSSELEYRANYDSLTGCINRFRFEKDLRALLEELPESGQEHALCFIDLDNFKTVNDTCGHPAGDALLIEITVGLNKRLRENDFLARLGGDEFAIVITDCDEQEALQVANHIFDYLRHYAFKFEDYTFPVSGSIGFVAINEQFCDFKTLVKAADSSSYAAKESGRNALVIFSGDQSSLEDEQESSWLVTLQEALKNDAFRLLTQSVASLDNRSAKTLPTHFELLPRLVMPSGEEASPEQYMKSAERYNLMAKVDRWVICNAIKHAAQSTTSPDTPFTFSLRLSRQALADADISEFIQSELKAHNVNASHLWFEFSEPIVASHLQETVQLIDCLRSLGSKIVLDDFGTGISSFKLIQIMPVDFLKIDEQLVQDMSNNPVSQELVKSIQQIGQAIGARTIAKYVNDQPTLDMLNTLGIDYAYGPFTSKIIPIETALTYWQSNKAA